LPSRYIREGWLESPAMQNAGEAAEVLFLRLALVADDYGRGDGRLDWIRSKCWPVGKAPEDLAERLATLARTVTVTPEGERIPLLIRYQVAGRDYWAIPKFRQRTRSQSKYPAPPEGMPADPPETPPGPWKPAEEAPNAGQLSDNRPTEVIHRKGDLSTENHDGHMSDVRERGRGRGRGRGMQLSDIRPSDDGQGAAGRSFESTQARLAEQREAAAKLPAEVELPESVRKFIPAPKAPNGDGHLEPGWDETTEGIEEAGKALGMKRLKLEADPDYAARIHARLSLG